jgi:hypothetical protein
MDFRISKNAHIYFSGDILPTGIHEVVIKEIVLDTTEVLDFNEEPNMFIRVRFENNAGYFFKSFFTDIYDSKSNSVDKKKFLNEQKDYEKFYKAVFPNVPPEKFGGDIYEDLGQVKRFIESENQFGYGYFHEMVGKVINIQIQNPKTKSKIDNDDLEISTIRNEDASLSYHEDILSEVKFKGDFYHTVTKWDSPSEVVDYFPWTKNEKVADC